MCLYFVINLFPNKCFTFKVKLQPMNQAVQTYLAYSCLY